MFASLASEILRLKYLNGRDWHPVALTHLYVFKKHSDFLVFQSYSFIFEKVFFQFFFHSVFEEDVGYYCVSLGQSRWRMRKDPC